MHVRLSSGPRQSSGKGDVSPRAGHGPAAAALSPWCPSGALAVESPESATRGLGGLLWGCAAVDTLIAAPYEATSASLKGLIERIGCQSERGQAAPKRRTQCARASLITCVITVLKPAFRPMGNVNVIWGKLKVRVLGRGRSRPVAASIPAAEVAEFSEV